MNSMANSKRSEQKEEYLKSKIKSCQPKRKTLQVESMFQESTRKPSKNQ